MHLCMASLLGSKATFLALSLSSLYQNACLGHGTETEALALATEAAPILFLFKLLHLFDSFVFSYKSHNIFMCVCVCVYKLILNWDKI